MMPPAMTSTSSSFGNWYPLKNCVFRDFQNDILPVPLFEDYDIFEEFRGFFLEKNLVSRNFDFPRKIFEEFENPKKRYERNPVGRTVANLTSFPKESTWSPKSYSVGLTNRTKS